MRDPPRPFQLLLCFATFSTMKFRVFTSSLRSRGLPNEGTSRPLAHHVPPIDNGDGHSPKAKKKTSLSYLISQAIARNSGMERTLGHAHATLIWKLLTLLLEIEFRKLLTAATFTQTSKLFLNFALNGTVCIAGPTGRKLIQLSFGQCRAEQRPGSLLNLASSFECNYNYNFAPRLGRKKTARRSHLPIKLLRFCSRQARTLLYFEVRTFVLRALAGSLEAVIQFSA